MKYNPLMFGSYLTTSIAQADSYPPVEENNGKLASALLRCLLAGMRRVHLLCRQLLLPLSSPRRIFEDFALWSVLNLPLAPNKRVTEEGLLVETQTPPTLMLGASYEVFKYEISETKSLGIDAGISVGRSLTLEGELFPVGAFRFKFSLHKTIRCM